jgi:hypothetical protein
MQHTPRYLLGAMALAVGLAACGGSKSPSAAPTTSTTASTGTAGATSTSSGAPNPNTTEVSPSGDIPDNQVFVPYSDTAGPFTVKVPEGWSRVDSASAVVFTDKLNSIRLEVVPAGAAPTVASATANEVPSLKASSSGYQAGTVTTVSRKGGTAVLIAYKADSAPDAVTGKVVHLDLERYEFWKAGKEAVLTLSGPVGADNVDPWKIVTDSFTWQ